MKPIPTVNAERRAHDRHPIRTEALARLPDGRLFTVQTLDIGRGGMAIVADVNPVVGSALAVRVSLPVHPSGHAVFEARAIVANCVLDGSEGGFRIGVQFLALDPQAKLVLARFLG